MNCKKLLLSGTVRRLFLAFSLILVTNLACSTPSQGEPGSQNNIETSVAQTTSAMDEIETGTSLTPNGERTKEPNEPTREIQDTPTHGLTPMPTTSSMGAYVSGDTNCRTGPGEVYERVGMIGQGQSVEAFAQEPDRSYYYVTNPGEPGEKCWVLGEYATPQGSFVDLPVYTPRPTPTLRALFQARYLQTTGFSSLFLEFEIYNRGTMPLESISVIVKDRDSGNTIPVRTRDGFGRIRGEGAASGTLDILQPGKQGFAYSDFFLFGTNTAVPGHQMSATLKGCTQDGLRGICISKTINFKAEK